MTTLNLFHLSKGLYNYTVEKLKITIEPNRIYITIVLPIVLLLIGIILYDHMIIAEQARQLVLSNEKISVLEQSIVSLTNTIEEMKRSEITPAALVSATPVPLVSADVQKYLAIGAFVVYVAVHIAALNGCFSGFLIYCGARSISTIKDVVTPSISTIKEDIVTSASTATIPVDTITDTSSSLIVKVVTEMGGSLKPGVYCLTHINDLGEVRLSTFLQLANEKNISSVNWSSLHESIEVAKIEAFSALFSKSKLTPHNLLEACAIAHESNAPVEEIMELLGNFPM